MTEKMDGYALAKKIAERVSREVSTLREKPCLAVVLVGENDLSKVYVFRKEVACEGVGMKTRNIKLSESASRSEIIEAVKKLNNDEGVHGILVQLPLPKLEDEQAVIEAVNPLKDVDGFHPENAGLLESGKPRFVPCTPKGVMRLLKEYGVQITGKHAVIIGRSRIVGKPLSTLLLQENATVTVCHSKTEDLAKYTRQADILISATGKPMLVTEEMIKEGAIIVDVGATKTEKGIRGDISRNAKAKASLYTPSIGGVGPMTIAMLLENTLQAFKGLQ